MRRPALVLLCAASVWGAATGSASAQEYCIACTDPPGLYRCIIEGARPGGAQPLPMLCVTTMAKQGGHARCSVKSGTVFECDGQIKRIPWTAEGPQESAPAPKPAAPPAKRDADGQPPKTMVDLAKKTDRNIKDVNKNFKESINETNQAIGKAAKKTWTCLTSFFTQCKN
ncbi:MAG TPA: hypothetical protein VG900_14040 [Hyphomicrobiaceae bacterium]|jgi:hypothetical protein|nr:hypothetical protein [Hyphomicrobiaceae bacterium]